MQSEEKKEGRGEGGRKGWQGRVGWMNMYTGWDRKGKGGRKESRSNKREGKRGKKRKDGEEKAER